MHLRLKPFALIFLTLLFSYVFASAQMPGGMGGNMNQGHFYGKVIDSATGKPMGYAVVELLGNKFDSASKSMKEGVIAGQITDDNGDFSLEHLPVFGAMNLKITAIGYADYLKKVSFDIDFSKLKKPAAGSTPDYSSLINMVDKDLGNIQMKSMSTQLQEVTINGTAPPVDLQIDKKVYNVDKNITSIGGTATDVLKNVPSVNVDVDGNITLRNTSPQILVDGMPTTLTMDEIPADAIQSIEVITNPGSKYDASGGTGGIINIVMKKDRKAGYSGNVRAGVDERGKINAGGNINMRQGKINVFANAFYNQRESKAFTQTLRDNLIGTPLTDITQNDTSTNKGAFGYGNLGFDYFIDNRNTVTISQTFVRGSFKPFDFLTARTDSLEAGDPFSTYDRSSNNSSTFRNWSTAVSFKHLFPKENETFTANGNVNFIKNYSDNSYTSQYFDMTGAPLGSPVQQHEMINGGFNYYTVQADFSDPIKKTIKIDAGVRGAIRSYSSLDNNFLFDDSTNEFDFLESASSNYTFTDQVYAAYFQFSQQIKKFSYQVGLRNESSFYTGTLVDSNLTFTNQYPIELFPSAYLSYNVDSKNEFQLNYSRRVNRPTFFQLIPYTNYTDSLNLQRGNPDLKPEFSNNIEFNYQRILNTTDILLFSLFFHQTDGLITNFQVPFTSPETGNIFILNTFENANSSIAYGAEVTSTNTIGKWLSLIADANVYNSQINATNLSENLTNNQFSFNIRISPTIKFPANFTLQLTGMYQSQAALPVSLSGSGGGGPGGGGGGFFGSPVSTVQGYVKPFWYTDAALKKEFMKNHALSLTLSCSDIFSTRKNATHSESVFFIQDYLRTRDPHYFRLTASYRFGKVDATLFKRKVIQNPADQIQDMGQGN